MGGSSFNVIIRSEESGDAAMLRGIGRTVKELILEGETYSDEYGSHSIKIIFDDVEGDLDAAEIDEKIKNLVGTDDHIDLYGSQLSVATNFLPSLGDNESIAFGGACDTDGHSFTYLALDEPISFTIIALSIIVGGYWLTDRELARRRPTMDDSAREAWDKCLSRGGRPRFVTKDGVSGSASQGVALKGNVYTEIDCQ